jgi:dihydroneopterin aldolase
MKEDDDDIQEYVSYRTVFPKKEYVMPVDRNEVLEEVAKEIEKMHAFEKDTMASFAAYIRGMKR